MDFLRNIHKETRKKQTFRDSDRDQPPRPEIENEYDYHDSSLSDDLRSQSQKLSALDKGDVDVQRLRESEYDKYQMMSQNDVRRRIRLTTTTHSSSAVRGNKSVSYTRKTTHDSSGSYTSSTSTIVTSLGDYHSDVDEDGDNENDEDDVWDDKDSSDSNMLLAKVLPSKTTSPMDAMPIPASTTKETSSSSWSVTLNDEDDDINNQDFSISTNGEKFEDPDQYKVYYEWDSDKNVMKPLLMKPSSKQAKTGGKVHQKWDLDNELDSAQDEEFGVVPEDLEDDEKELVKMFGEDIEGMDDEDGDMTNVSRYHQPWNDENVPRKLENWWDRDADLVDKAKRKLKLETLRNAQKNPLLKKCKTCPICKREWKGHKSMVTHVLNKGVCYKQLDETLKEQLTAHCAQLKKKKKNNRINDYPFEI
jgi:hypothetical protein